MSYLWTSCPAAARAAAARAAAVIHLVVTPQVSISQMSRAIEVELKQIGDQLKRLRRREKELLQDQEQYFAAAIARNSRGSYYDRWLANSLRHIFYPYI